MKVWEMAQPLAGWNLVKDSLPELGAKVEVLHFGNCPDMSMQGLAVMDDWGLCPMSEEGHGKRSTITHWR